MASYCSQGAVQCSAVQCPALHCTALLCIALICSVLHGTALHCTAEWYSEIFLISVFSTMTQMIMDKRIQVVVNTHLELQQSG